MSTDAVTTAPAPGAALPGKAAAPVLEVTDLEVRYGPRRRRRHALRGVSLSVTPGETVGIIGETGRASRPWRGPRSAWCAPRRGPSSWTARRSAGTALASGALCGAAG
jgi:ATPase components of various ABC-type transport systems, contain duplicated ATPase